ncbi:MAG TPA: ABC transporter substrate-binding protein, partial [Planctomycetota bacterium]|nr:ABC transporter substrate-binding protein [Planctomycetota bacterium]
MRWLVAVGLIALASGCPRKHEDMTTGKPFPPVSVMFNTNESHKQIAEAIVQMWREQLGVNVALGNTEWKVYLAAQNALDYDICRAGWINDFNDPHNDIEMFLTNGGNNRTGWSNKDYDRLVEEAKVQTDVGKRWETYRKAEAILQEEAPILPIYYYTNKNMLARKVKGWYDTVLNIHPYDAIWIEDEPGKPNPPEKQVLVFNNGAEPATLDPGHMSGVPEHHIALAVFEGLCRCDPRTLAPLPGVAERWEISPDGKRYVFHLRSNARWQDSQGNDRGPVTAQDFVYSWSRVVKTPEGEEPSEYQYVFDWVEGGQALREGRSKDLATFGVHALDERTLEVKLETPCGFFLDLCAYDTLMPVHRETIEKHGLQWTKPENFVGNGPFLLSEWTPLKSVICKKSPLYWRASENRLETLRMLPVEDQNTFTNMFLNGEVDWLDDVPLARADQVLRNPCFRSSAYLG